MIPRLGSTKFPRKLYFVRFSAKFRNVGLVPLTNMNFQTNFFLNFVEFYPFFYATLVLKMEINTFRAFFFVKQFALFTMNKLYRKLSNFAKISGIKT